MSVHGDIHFLFPIFEEFWTNGEQREICNNLMQSKKISEECFADLAQQNVPLYQTLIKALALFNEKEWGKILIEELNSIGKFELAVFVQAYLSKSDANLLWIANNWDELISNSLTFAGLKGLLPKINARKSQQLLDVALQCVQPVFDDKMIRLIIEKMKSNLNLQLNPSESDWELLENIQPMLSNELTLQQILDVGKFLHANDAVPSDIVAHVQNGCGELDCAKAMEIIANAVGNTARPKWKEILRDGVFNTVGVFHANIVDVCFNHPEALVFQWIVCSWKQLKEKRDLVSNCCFSLFGPSEWFLSATLVEIVNSLMDQNPEIIQGFARLLSQHLNVTTTPSPAVPTSTHHPFYFGPTVFGASAHGPMPYKSVADPTQLMIQQQAWGNTQMSPRFLLRPPLLHALPQEYFPLNNYHQLPHYVDPGLTSHIQQSPDHKTFPAKNEVKSQQLLEEEKTKDEPSDKTAEKMSAFCEHSFEGNQPTTNLQEDEKNCGKIEKPIKDDVENENTSTVVPGDTTTFSTAKEGAETHKSKSYAEVLISTQQNENQVNETNIKSKGVKTVKVITCMKPYVCEGIQLVTPKNGEIFLEFRLVVAEGLKQLKNPYNIFVFVKHLNRKFQMHQDHTGPSSDCFHAFVKIEKGRTEIMYKYLARNSCDHWEAVPKPNTTIHLKRVKDLQSNEVSILFDVCSFLDSSKPLNIFSKMCEQNISKHLCNISSLFMVGEEDICMNYKMYNNYLCNWWISAQKGILFTNSMKKQFAKSVFQECIRMLPKPKTALTLVLIHLPICKFLFQIKKDHAPFDNMLFEELATLLDTTGLDIGDFNTIYENAKSLDIKILLQGCIYVFDKVSKNAKCLLLLPLFYVLMNEGKCGYKQSAWEKMESKTRIMQCVHKLEKTNPETNFMVPKLEKFADLFPQLPKVYQKTLPLKTACNLFKTHKDFMIFLDAKYFLTLIERSMDKTYPILNEDVSKWIYQKLKCQLNLADESSESKEKIQTQADKILSKVYETFKNHKNYCLLSFSLSVVLLFKTEVVSITRRIKSGWMDNEKDIALSQEKKKFLNNLLELQCEDEETGKNWKTQAEYLLTEFFTKCLGNDINFVNKFDETPEPEPKLNEVVIGCFYKALENVLAKHKQDQSWKEFFLNVFLGKNLNLFQIIEKRFLKMWQSVEGNCADIALKLLYNPVELCYCKIIAKSPLPHTSQKPFKEFQKGLATLLHQLNTGNLPFKSLKSILNTADTFSMALSTILIETMDENTINLKELLSIRENELCFVEEFQKIVQCFVDVCQSAVEGLLQSSWLTESIEETTWSDVIDCYIPGKRKTNTKPRITLFGLTAKQQNAMSEIYAAKVADNKFVLTKWNEFYNDALQNKQNPTNDVQAKENMLTLDDVVSCVWASMLKFFCPLKIGILHGDVPLTQVDKYFKDLEKVEIEKLFESICCFPSNHAENGSEMQILCDSNSSANKQLRKDQLCNYIAIKKQQPNVSAFIVIKDCLDLKGDFGYLDILQDEESISRHKVLNTITDSIINVGKLFQDITEKHCDLIKGFIEQTDLIEWLKTMKDRSEVKVMSDLGMISAGESVVDVDRISCFLSAVMGFAPFIYDLNPESAGLEDVVFAVKRIYDQSESAELLEKWKATASSLKWLKGIKDSHGSVEESSLLKVQNINTKGVYSVGGGGLVPNVEECVKLSWTSTNDGTEEKDMTLSNLQDLQSRLMLIEDKNLKGVDMFIQTLALVENLAQAYVNLKVAGCLLFDKWMAKIQVNEDNENTVCTKIIFDDESQALCFQKNKLDELQKLVSIMTQTLNSWKRIVFEKRSSYYHLNHYNMQQINYMCKELALASKFGCLPDQLYTLLSVIKHDITQDELLECLANTTILDDESTDESSREEGNVPMSEDEKKREIVAKLLEDGVELKVAKATVRDAVSFDYVDLYLESLNNMHEDDEVARLAEEFDDVIGFDQMEINHTTFDSVVKNKSNHTLSDVINNLLDARVTKNLSDCFDSLCNHYIQEESLKTSLMDTISLDHLGQFLTNISLLVDQSAIPNRSVPGLLHKNVNLVICNEEDTFTNIISLYMESPQEPLPSNTEVFLCTDKTDEVELEPFLRRAVDKDPKKGNRIYCLAHTEKLAFEVANSLHNNLRKLQNDNFTVVLLCSSPQHFIASLFYENKINYIIKHSDDNIREFFEKKMTIHDHHKPGNPSTLLVTSHKAGLGKSLYISRLREKLHDDYFTTTIRFLEKDCNSDYVMNHLLNSGAKNTDPQFVHLDVTPAVKNGINNLLFHLLILGSCKDSHGFVWQKHTSHIYCVEYTYLEKDILDKVLLHLPTIRCLSPLQLVENTNSNDLLSVGMDQKEFLSETFQRPYQYLLQHKLQHNLDDFTYKTPKDNPMECLHTLYNFCGVKDPSWSLLKHFASFLNCQLSDCEKSVFCDTNLTGSDSGLSGFKSFVVKFMIRMSQDFATPSLDSSPEHKEGVFGQHQLRRSWEEGKHPYLFFNEDRMSMTFVNFMINHKGDLISTKTNEILEKNIMQRKLLNGLRLQRVNFRQNFNSLSRSNKLKTLYQVFGIEGDIQDPDPTYELTTENVLKMLAIHMRFRCDIPVIIMGETGCGKTRMVEFMSKIKANNATSVKNIVTVTVHGGITVKDIQEKILEALDLANQNKGKTETTLFLDEANTTEAIYAIKEFVCDGSVCGKSKHRSCLNIVAACNPYRKHNKEAITKMENAGLGFKVKTDDTSDKLGEIPMRWLVYRVVALPPSMHPLVWDFGQLDEMAERVYIEQMAHHETVRETVGLQSERDLLVHMLCTSQAFMRQNRQDCLFVSLRDVERCLKCFKWFCNNKDWLLEEIKIKQTDKSSQSEISDTVQCLIHSFGMCYHATLTDRLEYRKKMSECLADVRIKMSESQILQEIVACQNVFLNEIQLKDNIASNEALRENVFMIVMCCELRIPLFLIGKPGSSKSLAKSIVADVMQGSNSNSNVFQKLKQIHVLSFQCSPITEVSGIQSIFKQCESLQEKQDTTKFVAVVVLDEIGLAEDSPKMPLKVLHPLLEGGVRDSQSSLQLHDRNKNISKHVGFVGISNWALDPAKLNRGLFVHRLTPSESELNLTAQGIFPPSSINYQEVSSIVQAATKSYLEISEKWDKTTSKLSSEEEIFNREFFGLRDYYGLLKMIYAVYCDGEVTPQFYDVLYAVKRNFDGSKLIDCMQIFVDNFKTLRPCENVPGVTLKQIVSDNLQSKLNNDTHFESRYLLLMTDIPEAVILLGTIIDRDVKFVFGSSFSQDNTYTEKCRNINRIKMCMEAGSTVLLLNLKDLYESLYDALNQHYVTFKGQRYVDLGLGGHRVKCRVHKNFRLIVMEDTEIVYRDFPIPLINRLEKHFLTTKCLLSTEQITDTRRLETWMEDFSTISQPLYLQNSVYFTKKDVFVGYTNETVGSAIITTQNRKNPYEEAKHLLLRTVTCDGVLRLAKSGLKREAPNLAKTYFEQQQHDNLLDLLKSFVTLKTNEGILQLDITSFSKILSENDRMILKLSLEPLVESITLVTLQQFKTQEEFSARVVKFLHDGLSAKENVEEMYSVVLLIQCPEVQTTNSLIACAKYTVQNILLEKQSVVSVDYVQFIVAFLYTLERRGPENSNKKMKTFISSDTCSLYVDELCVTADHLGSINIINKYTLGELLNHSVHEKPYIVQTDVRRNTTNFAEPEFALDFKKLLLASLPLALTKLQAVFKTAQSDRFLLSAFFSDDDPVCKAFVQELIKCVVKMAQCRDSKMVLQSSWVTNVAFNSEALQEGGSLKKTLWLHLRNIMSSLLASFISEVNTDQNLLILCSSNQNSLATHLKQVWFDLFHVNTIFCATWDNLEKVHRYFVRGIANFACQFPYSRKVLSVFQKQWELVQNQENSVQLFHSKIKNMRLNHILTNALESHTEEVLNCFVHDMVHLHYKCGSHKKLEFQMIQNTLMEIWKQKQYDLDVSVTSSSNLVSFMFVLMKMFSLELKQVAFILELIPQILSDDIYNEFLKRQADTTTIVIHFGLLEFALKHIIEISETLTDVLQYQKWAKLIGQLRPTAEAILLNTESESLHKTWKALQFGALFSEHLIPQGLTEATQKGYIKVFMQPSKLLWKGALKVDLNTDTYLRLIVKTLNGCVKKVRLMYLVDFQDSMCKFCNKTVSDPVVLPCKHFMCCKCTRLITIDRQCPICRKVVHENFEFKPTTLTANQAKDMEVLTGNCTSFFMEYLSVLCFPASSTSCRENEITQLLFSLVFQNKDQKDKSSLQSSFLYSADTVRSYILQLLLRHNEAIKHELENHFTTNPNDSANFMDLMIVYVHCKEDMLHKNISSQLMPQLLQEQIAQLQEGLVVSQLQQLDLVANLQCIINNLVELVYQEINNNETKEFVSDIIDALLNMDEEIIKVYFIKCFCRRYGISFFSNLFAHDQLKNFIPGYLYNCFKYQPTDMLLVAGEVVVSTKKHLDQIDEHKTIQVFKQICNQNVSQLQVVLGSLSWAVLNVNTSKQNFEVTESLLDHLYHHSSIKKLIYSLSKKMLSLIPNVFSLQDFTHQIVANLFINAAIVTGFSSGLLVGEVYNLVKDHLHIAEKFLPTMPQSSYFDVKDFVEKWIDPAHKVPPKKYFCPNGHLYVVGNCGNVIPTNAVCPDCKAPIGGKDYGKLQPGNTAGDISEASQAGYKLPSPEQRGLEATPERKCNKLTVCVIRFLLHSQLLLNTSELGIQSLLKVNGEEEARTLLLSHLNKDFEQFHNSIGRSLEDSALLLHYIFKQIADCKTNEHSVDANFDSIKGRQVWETEFHSCYLQPVFAHVEQNIHDSWNVIFNARQKSDLEWLVYELQTSETTMPMSNVDVIPWNQSLLWKYHVNITVNHLRQKLNANVTCDADEGALLQMILDNQSIYDLCQLEEIIELQTKLVDRYRHKVDIDDLDKITIDDYLNDGDSLVSKEKFIAYMDLWNKLQHNIKQKFGSTIPNENFYGDLSFQSPISKCIPSKVGKGQCALCLTTFVIQQQNELIERSMEIIKPKPQIKTHTDLQLRFLEAATSELTCNDIILIDNDETLLPYVLANAQYEKTIFGSNHEIHYRIPAIEKQSIECIEFLQDMGMVKEFMMLEQNVKQNQLPVKLLQKLEDLRNIATMPVICEAVRTLTLVVKHLSKMKNDELADLIKYIKDDLMLPPEEADNIPHLSQLCHTRALFEWFSWQRSVKYVLLGQNPFRNIIMSETQELIEDVENIEKFLVQIDTEQLQMEINSLLMMKSDFYGNAKLKDYLAVFAEERDVCDATWITKMPDEICVKHAVHLFKLAVK